MIPTYHYNAYKLIFYQTYDISHRAPAANRGLSIGKLQYQTYASVIQWTPLAFKVTLNNLSLASLYRVFMHFIAVHSPGTMAKKLTTITDLSPPPCFQPNEAHRGQPLLIVQTFKHISPWFKTKFCLPSYYGAAT